jgi:hypothetical protein
MGRSTINKLNKENQNTIKQIPINGVLNESTFFLFHRSSQVDDQSI